MLSCTDINIIACTQLTLNCWLRIYLNYLLHWACRLYLYRRFCEIKNTERYKIRYFKVISGLFLFSCYFYKYVHVAYISIKVGGKDFNWSYWCAVSVSKQVGTLKCPNIKEAILTLWSSCIYRMYAINVHVCSLPNNVTVQRWCNSVK